MIRSVTSALHLLQCKNENFLSGIFGGFVCPVGSHPASKYLFFTYSFLPLNTLKSRTTSHLK